MFVVWVLVFMVLIIFLYWFLIFIFMFWMVCLFIIMFESLLFCVVMCLILFWINMFCFIRLDVCSVWLDVMEVVNDLNLLFNCEILFVIVNDVICVIIWLLFMGVVGFWFVNCFVSIVKKFFCDNCCLVLFVILMVFFC